MFITSKSLKLALDHLYGTANHLIKIWFALKQMGMTQGVPVVVTTSSPKSALDALFCYGEDNGRYFVPFAHTDRYLTMLGHASRSVIQTTVRQWVDHTAVNCDPTAYIDVRDVGQGIEVKPGRRYPMGLGYGVNGFAREDGSRVIIPDLSFAYWYYRRADIGDGGRATLIPRLYRDLRLDRAEYEAVFVEEKDWHPVLQRQPLTDARLYQCVTEWRDAGPSERAVVAESQEKYTVRIKTTMSNLETPVWLRTAPGEQLRSLVDCGCKAILLYGPPRGGKTRAIDQTLPRNDLKRETIQIHDGWGYDELMLSFRPNKDGEWSWVPGPLLSAIRGGKKFIVLEEINRTQASQALGEVFSLLEERYRGDENAIKLRDGSSFFIPTDVVIIATMNTLDKSVEELDDALLGRFAGVEYPARVEDLISMLEQNKVEKSVRDKIAEFFAFVQPTYPLGHGYMAQLKPTDDFLAYYRNRIRPVLQSHLRGYRDQDLYNIDEKIDQLFSASQPRQGEAEA